MDQKISFTSYDFWAYLSSGFMLLFALDQAAGTKLLERANWTAVQGAIAVSIAYVAGQIISSTSAWLYEKLLVGKLLGYPRSVLFGKSKAWWWVRALMPSYFETIPVETQKAILSKGAQLGIDTAGDALFWPAHIHARKSAATASRLENFLNLYGFCRNTALVALIDAGVLHWSYLQPNGPEEHLLWARLSLVVSFGMTLRYLKFYRHFALEVFTVWAFENDQHEGKQR